MAVARLSRLWRKLSSASRNSSCEARPCFRLSCRTVTFCCATSRLCLTNRIAHQSRANCFRCGQFARNVPLQFCQQHAIDLARIPLPQKGAANFSIVDHAPIVACADENFGGNEIIRVILRTAPRASNVGDRNVIAGRRSIAPPDKNRPAQRVFLHRPRAQADGPSWMSTRRSSAAGTAFFAFSCVAMKRSSPSGVGNGSSGAEVGSHCFARSSDRDIASLARSLDFRSEFLRVQAARRSGRFAQSFPLHNAPAALRCLLRVAAFAIRAAPRANDCKARCKRRFGSCEADRRWRYSKLLREQKFNFAAPQVTPESPRKKAPAQNLPAENRTLCFRPKVRCDVRLPRQRCTLGLPRDKKWSAEPGVAPPLFRLRSSPAESRDYFPASSACAASSVERGNIRREQESNAEMEKRALHFFLSGFAGGLATSNICVCRSRASDRQHSSLYHRIRSRQNSPPQARASRASATLCRKIAPNRVLRVLVTSAAACKISSCVPSPAAKFPLRIRAIHLRSARFSFLLRAHGRTGAGRETRSSLPIPP